MTIGIAAYGPSAGKAVLRALAAVEGVGRGAIGGFVSFVAITKDGIERLETQRGGSSSLLRTPLPQKLADAQIAGLMSSGPDRPNPLSQFTPADVNVGLVTGHRMPNTKGESGTNLNDEVLALMGSGLSPEVAVERVISSNPDVDAGIIALSTDGRAYAANTRHVLRRGDVGSAQLGSALQGAIVAVLHNAIRPHGPMAALAAELALDTMLPRDRPDAWITFREGIRLAFGKVNTVCIGSDGIVETIFVDNPARLRGEWSLGVGYETEVIRAGQTVARLLYEPYMIVSDGQLKAIDGLSELAVPIRFEPIPAFGGGQKS